MGLESMINTSILLVDDDAFVRQVIVEYLNSYGLTDIIQAENGMQALRIVSDDKAHIDLIISDWEMPGMSGLTLLKKVRTNPLRNVTPFILITSQRSMERYKITRAAYSQVSAYIVKPFRSDTLRDKIWEVMGWSNIDEKQAV